MKNSSFLPLALLLPALFIQCSGPPTSGTVMFYAGSSDWDVEHGIFLCGFDYATREISRIDSFAGSISPYYMTLSPDRRFVYTVDKNTWDDITKEQMVTAYRKDPQDHSLTLVNSQGSGGIGPCHIRIFSDQSFVLLANYGSGQVTACLLDADGSLLPATDVVQLAGSGPVASRQEGPHAHYVGLDRRERYVLVPDLGSDKVWIFTFDKNTGLFAPNPAQKSFVAPPGSGPRHLDFHPSGSYVYVLYELTCTLAACSFDEKNGTMAEINSVSTIPDDHRGDKSSAAVRVHPNGQFVYASNRLDKSSIAVFSIAGDGSIERIQIQEDVPYWPRDFNIDPSGRYMLVAGERSNEVAVYTLDPETGMIAPTGNKAAMPSIANIVFID